MLTYVLFITVKDDYGSGPYNMTFSAGSRRVVFDVPIIDDTKRESNETFSLIIDDSSLPSRVFTNAFRPREATVTIVDDDQGNQKQIFI